MTHSQEMLSTFTLQSLHYFSADPQNSVLKVMEKLSHSLAHLCNKL